MKTNINIWYFIVMEGIH